MSCPPSLPETCGSQPNRAAGDGKLLDRRERHPDLGAVVEGLEQPPNHVTAAVASRCRWAHGDSQVHLASGGVQLLGDLGAGLAAADDEDASGGQLAGPAVLAGVHLVDVIGQLRTGGWDARSLVRAGG